MSEGACGSAAVNADQRAVVPSGGRAVIECPALRHQDKDYPARFGGRVPRRILMQRTVYPECPGMKPGTVARQGEKYDAWTNSHGAVSAVCGNGQHLGVKPVEFVVIGWHDDGKSADETGRRRNLRLKAALAIRGLTYSAAARLAVEGGAEWSREQDFAQAVCRGRPLPPAVRDGLARALGCPATEFDP
jgi:hypothetical protein